MEHSTRHVYTLPDGSPVSKEEWLAWMTSEPEPVPLNTFPLHSKDGRMAFLREFYGVGYPALFEAVSHVWDSLADPQDYRCTLMGVHSGAGGSGKAALWNTLRQFVSECLASNHPIPPRADFATLEEWHHAAMATFEADERDVELVLSRYERILNGEAPATSEPRAAGEVIQGCWDSPVSGSANDHVQANQPRTVSGREPQFSSRNLRS